MRSRGRVAVPIFTTRVGIHRERPTGHGEHVPYTEPLYPHRARCVQGLLDGRFIGQRSPASGKVYIPGKGYDPIARVRMTAADDVELPPTGTVVSYTVAAPLDYAGQTETEPFVSAAA